MVNNIKIQFLKYLITSLFILVLLPIQKTSAAPAPDYFAINESEKTCGRYWPGDERSQYELPTGWTTYNDEDYLTTYSLDTPFGKCVMSTSNNFYDDPSTCAKQLNLKYINYLSLPVNQNDIYKPVGKTIVDRGKFGPNEEIPAHTGGPYKCGVSEWPISSGILINSQTHQFSEAVGFSFIQPQNSDDNVRPEGKDCYITDDNWKLYSDVNIETILNTPFGICKECSTLDIKKSCDQLGLKYVGNIGQKTKSDGSSTDQQMNNTISFITYITILILLFLVGILFHKREKIKKYLGVTSAASVAIGLVFKFIALVLTSPSMDIPFNPIIYQISNNLDYLSLVFLLSSFVLFTLSIIFWRSQIKVSKVLTVIYLAISIIFILIGIISYFISL